MSRWSTIPVTLRQLQYVVAVAELASFRRAAEACAVAQPSLSSQIQQLEDALGVRVFERSSKSVSVTRAGAAVVERAKRTLLEADDLVATAARARDPLAGTLRVGILPTIAPYLLPDIAPVLRATFPRLTILWFEERTRELVERIAAGDLDAGIVALESKIGGLDHEAILEDAFLLAVPPGHRLARARTPAKLDEIEGETVLLLDDGHCLRDQALAVCERAGADEASIRGTSLSTLAQMVASGAGVTLLPSIAVATENRAKGLVVRSFGARAPYRTIAIAWRRGGAVEPAARAIGRALSTVAKKLVATNRSS
jgi:LysR family hydrogen peroxide-inducible transcriptional activator